MDLDPLIEKAEALAEGELERLNAVELVYQPLAEMHVWKENPGLPGEGSYLKMYRIFTSSQLWDIYRSESLMFPLTYDIAYFYDVMITTPQFSTVPDAQALAQSDNDFYLHRKGMIRFRYSCDKDGNLKGDPPAVLPRENYYEVGKLLEQEGGPHPNPYPIARVTPEFVPPVYDSALHDRGLLKNGSMNYWNTRNPYPYGFNYQAGYSAANVPYVVKRYAGKTDDGGFAVLQTWYHSDASFQPREKFGTDVNVNVEPASTYSLSVRADNLSWNTVYVEFSEYNSERKIKGPPQTIVEVPSTRDTTVFHTFEGTFTTSQDDVLAIRINTASDNKATYPVSVVWDEWTLTKAATPGEAPSAQ